MSLQLMIVVLYVAMLFAISFYVKRRAETSATEYQFAGRKFGALLTGLRLTTVFILVFLATMFAPDLCRRNTVFYTTLVGLLAWQMFPLSTDSALSHLL